MVPNSVDYFMVSCSYFEKTCIGVNRLTGALVFCTGAIGTVRRTTEIILQYFHHEPGCSGAEFKVALTANHFKDVISILDPPQKENRNKKRKRFVDPPQKKNRSKKRKRKAA